MLSDIIKNLIHSSDGPCALVFLIDTGKVVSEAIEKALQYMGDRVQGAGGAIAVCPSGEWAAEFTTERMAWACVDGEALHYGLNPQEKFRVALWGTPEKAFYHSNTAEAEATKLPAGMLMSGS